MKYLVWNCSVRERNIRLQEGARVRVLQGEAGRVERARDNADH